MFVYRKDDYRYVISISIDEFLMVKRLATREQISVELMLSKLIESAIQNESDKN